MKSWYSDTFVTKSILTSVSSRLEELEVDLVTFCEWVHPCLNIVHASGSIVTLNNYSHLLRCGGGEGVEVHCLECAQFTAAEGDNFTT